MCGEYHRYKEKRYYVQIASWINVQECSVLVAMHAVNLSFAVLVEFMALMWKRMEDVSKVWLY